MSPLFSALSEPSVFRSNPSFQLPVTVTTLPDQQGAVYDDRAGLLLWNKKPYIKKYWI